MDYDFNNLLPFEKRMYSMKMKKTYENKILVIVNFLNNEHDSLRIIISENVNLMSISKLIIKKRNISGDKSVFLFVKKDGNFNIISTNLYTIGTIFNKYKDDYEDILYLYISFNQTFGNN